jgi:hypothetical protein
MIDDVRYTLIGGDYSPPKFRVGDKLYCELRQKDVVVGGISDGIIEWPTAKKTGKRSLILCGDLVRAVQVESGMALSYHFGVNIHTVSNWRKALGVGQYTDGTLRLHQITYAESSGPAIMVAAPWEDWTEARKAKLRDSIRESPKRNCWTPEEDAVLSSASVSEIAKRLGRSVKAVHQRRCNLGLTTPRRPKN